MDFQTQQGPVARNATSRPPAENWNRFKCQMRSLMPNIISLILYIDSTCVWVKIGGKSLLLVGQKTSTKSATLLCIKIYRSSTWTSSYSNRPLNIAVIKYAYQRTFIDTKSSCMHLISNRYNIRGRSVWDLQDEPL